MREIWRNIPKYNGLYQISNLGNVRKITINGYKNISKFRNSQGYEFCRFQISGFKHSNLVHRLVLEAFMPNPENKPFVNHINGIKDDNRLENLEWCTHSENMKHAYDHNLNKKRYGTKNSNFRAVWQYDLQDNFIQEFSYIKLAGEVLNIPQQSISACCRGVHKSTHGFKFKYSQED